MFLKHLALINFKNYEGAELSFSSKINCFVGNNGVGKTNLLDAIHYLSMCKSFFNPIDSQNIQYLKDFFVIQGDYFRNEENEEIYCGLKRNKKKQFRRNKKDYTRLADHIGLLPIVMISPSDISLIMDGSEERRKLINGVIAQYDKAYLDDLLNYNKVLSQRNKLLKDFGRSGYTDTDTLEAWDAQLVVLGKRIFEKREHFTQKLVPIFQRYYDFISDKNEKVTLTYVSHLHNGAFDELLKKSLSKDKILEYTTTGVHKDDLLLEIGGYPIKKNGSQGQQKTFLVALKLAKFDFIKEINKIPPILLLDDIFDKFDAKRVEKIIHLVADNTFGQIFITDTHQERLEKILSTLPIEHKLFKINKDIQEITP